MSSSSFQNILPTDSASDRRDVVVAVKDASKAYRIWRSPSARLQSIGLHCVKQVAKPLWQRCSDAQSRLYRDFYALKDVNLTLCRGETIGIIGRNGSGKSTLLQMIAGTLPPTSGQIDVTGRVAALLELGSGFNPDFTGRENVLLNGSILGFSDESIRSLFSKIESFAGIGEFIDRPVRTYSSGMMVRLAFSVVAHLNPDILIIDEALAVGDVFFQQKCMNFIREQLGSVGKIIVSHDSASIARLCSQVYLLEEGHIIFQGPPREAFEQYTKRNHTALFSVESKDKEPEKAAEIAPTGKEDPWVQIEEQQLGGRLDYKLSAFKVLINGSTYPGYVEFKQKVSLCVRINGSRVSDRLILGYLISDLQGVPIFGENSLSSLRELMKFEKIGSYEFMFEFTWPDIKNGKYFLTVGIGEGDDSLNHVVQCWAHNIFLCEVIAPGQSFHALFNNRILAIRQL